MKALKLSILVVCLSIIYSCSSPYPDLDEGLYAEFETSKGNFVTELYFEDVPMTVGNFVALTEGIHPLTEKRYQDRRLYDSLIFHRVIKDFMIQGGDPRGTGYGGPGFKFPDEINDELSHDSKGTLSMANMGPNSNGSQFFITLKPTPFLDGDHSVFGQVVLNQSVVDSIGEVETNEAERPVEKVYINKVNILRKGQKAEDYDAVQAFTEAYEAHQTQMKKDSIQRERLIEDISEGYEVTESGLRYKITRKVKQGKSPVPHDLLKVHYEGFLVDSTKFDSSLDRGMPIQIELGVGAVIPGWDEGLQLLKEGEKATFIIPPYLSYNEKAAGPVPAYSILIFDVELVEVNSQ